MTSPASKQATGGSDAPVPPLETSPKPKRSAELVVRHRAVERGEATEGPHVVVVLACTVRQDQVGAYGGPSHTTPFLDELARTGVRFSDPIAAAPWTRMASAALVTGRHALALGMVEPSQARNDRRLPDGVVTLAEQYAARGYQTVGGTTNPNLNGVYGFDRGFETYVEPSTTWAKGHRNVSGREAVKTLLAEVPVVEPGGPSTYVQMMLIDAHSPFKAKALPEDVNMKRGRPRRYRAALRSLDDRIKQLWSGLNAKGYTEANTVFVVTSDHGEGLSAPEHHGISHGRYLYSTAVKTIWLMRGPGIGRGVVVDGLASQVDLFPTLLRTGGKRDWSGLLSKGGRTTRTRAFTDTWFRQVNRASVRTDDTVCMRSFHPRVYARDPTGSFVAGCYDRIGDPMQLTANPSPDNPLWSELETWRAQTEGAASTESVPVSDEMSEQLELLGYTSDD